MSFDVAQLNAHLQAETAGFLRNLEGADRAMDHTEAAMRHLELAGREAGHVLNDVKVTSAQAFESRAALETIERSVSGVSAAALIAADRLHDVKVTQTQALESKAATSEIKDQLDGVIVKAEEARLALRRVNGGAGGGGTSGGALAGILPGGARARPAAIGALIAAGLSTLPSVAPAGLGLAAGAANLGLGLAGSAGVLFGALHGINAQSFSDKKAFGALDPAQKQLVQDLRSLSAGLGDELSRISETILPHLSAELHAAFSPGTTTAITNDVHAFADATSQVADMWGKFLGGPFGTELGGLLQHDAQYLVPLNDELMHMFDFVVQLLNIATPFTDWLSQTMQLAAGGADEWAHSAEGVQTLTAAFAEGQAGLEALAHVAGGALDVLASIWHVTEGGSGPALEVLAGGLREVAAIIEDNRDELARFFEGGVTAAHDILAAVDALRPLLHGLVAVIDDGAGAIGGWRTVMDGFAAWFIAKWALGKLGVDVTVKSILGIGPATTSATAEADAALATLVAAANEASIALSGIGAAAVEGTAVADAAIAGTAAEATVAAGEVGGLRAALLGLGAPEVLAAIAAAFGAYKLISETTGVAQQQYTTDGQGHYYFNQPTKYGSVKKSVSKDEYNAAMGYGAVPTGADRHGPAADRAPAGMTFSQQQIRKLLLANGVPADVATNLAIISAHGEDPSGNPAALNDNPGTGDYSIGLFQENFLGQMGVDRTKKFAPQFGLSPTTPVKDFVKWLGQHPAAQAQIAYQIFQSQGYGAWTTAAGLGITGGGSSMDPFGTPPPFSTDTTKKKAIPTGLGLLPTALATALENAQAAAAGFGSSGGGGSGFGDPAKTIAAERGVVNAAQDALDFLDKQKATGKELVNISRERLALEKEIASATKVIHAAQLQQQHDATATKERNILGLDSSGAAATPSVLALRSQAKAMAAELTKAAGEGLDVTDATATLAKLQRVLKFNFIPPDVRAAVANQIAALKQTVSSGMSQLLDTAKQNLSDATSAFEAGFSSAITAADQQFEQNVSNAAQALQILVHGPFGDFLFGGDIKSTPAGKALASLTDAHTLQGLNKNLKDAQDAVAKAQGGDSRVFDFATGLTTTTPGDQQSLLDAQQQLADAQFALDQYNLGKQADAEQSAADAQLSAAQNAYTQQQRLVETAMDQQVAAIEAGMEAGTITSEEGFAEIEKIWASHGINLEAISFALGGQIYNGLSQGLAPVFALLQSLIDALNHVRDLAGLPPVGYDTTPITGGFLPGTGLIPIGGHAVPMAGGGYIPPRPGGTLVRAAEAGKGEFFIPEDKMGGGGVHITVPIAGDVYTMDADEFARKIAPAIREQLILTNRSTTSLFG